MVDALSLIHPTMLPRLIVGRISVSASGKSSIPYRWADKRQCIRQLLYNSLFPQSPIYKSPHLILVERLGQIMVKSRFAAIGQLKNLGMSGDRNN